MSSEPIHGSERLPTEGDACSGDVLYWSFLQGVWLKTAIHNIHDENWWKPLDSTPPPPEPPKPKRRRYYVREDPGNCEHVAVHRIHRSSASYGGLTLTESLPTDPDWEELLEAIDNHDSSRTWAGNLKRIKEVRNRNVK